MRFLQNLSINVSTLKRKMGSKFYSSCSFHSRLSQDLSLMLNDSDANDYNVIIKAGEHPNIKEFPAHSYILRARSPYFKSALSTNNNNNNNMIIEFKKPNINPTLFGVILK